MDTYVGYMSGVHGWGTRVGHMGRVHGYMRPGLCWVCMGSENYMVASGRSLEKLTLELSTLHSIESSVETTIVRN